MACLTNVRICVVGSGMLVASMWVGACFNPDLVPIDTDSSSGTSETVGASTGSDTMEGCNPGSIEACVCPDGSSGMRVCETEGFGPCECDDADSTGSTSTGEPPECVADADCTPMAEGECEQGVCSGDGTCSVEPLAEGEPCGDPAEAECSGADSCDGAGACVANDRPDGAMCDGCPEGICSCMGGVCGECPAFAGSNDFITSRSVDGWELTGGWTLYREAPQSLQAGPAVFSGQVFGTDGNRVAPYPSFETETSYARTAPFIVPASLDFLSWNLDEGSGVDTKTIGISIDGGMSFTTLVDCNLPADMAMYGFCQFVIDREPDAWDIISIPLPPGLEGQMGIVEFTYDTLDECCNFEQGWYIDATNFATECACMEDSSCEGLGGECGPGVCGGNGECELEGVAAGTACGDATDVECNAPDACDGAGYCAPNEAATGLSSCSDCPAGAGSCNTCQAGMCIDCMVQPVDNDFSNGTGSFEGWLIEDLGVDGADWQIFFSAPQSTDAMSVPTPLSFSPSFGTDGNRVAPYGDGLSEEEFSRVTTSPDVVGPSITFDSWNVDEGSQPFDSKLIELSVDDGATWNVLIDCELDPMAQPFCQLVNDPRDGADWDSIVLDTAAWDGQVGILRFTYNTGDGCCDFERGWFIDNLNFAQYCSDAAFPPPP